MNNNQYSHPSSTSSPFKYNSLKSEKTIHKLNDSGKINIFEKKNIKHIEVQANFANYNPQHTPTHTNKSPRFLSFLINTPKNGSIKYQPAINLIVQHCVPSNQNTSRNRSNTIQNYNDTLTDNKYKTGFIYQPTQYTPKKTTQLKKINSIETNINQLYQYAENNTPSAKKDINDKHNLDSKNASLSIFKNYNKNPLSKPPKAPHFPQQHQKQTRFQTPNKIKPTFKLFNQTQRCLEKKMSSHKFIKLQSLKNNDQNYIFGINKNFEKQNKETKIKSIKLQDFQIGKSLGKGQFGTVFLARHKETNSIYAIKEVTIKSVKISQNIFNQFLLEIKILSFVSHPNILKFFGCFRENQNIYLILEYMESGSLYNIIKKTQVVSEAQTVSYMKQIINGVQYLHQKQICHRDLKPENIVVSFGVCKVCDFGWATTTVERRKTSCGTLDYIAPQIIQGHTYDCSIDLWCLGVLTYELLMGKTPFYHSSRKQTMIKIINVNQPNITYENMSEQAISFIQGLLKKNPSQRYTIDNLINHSFLIKE